jgi:hypothetical protein
MAYDVPSSSYSGVGWDRKSKKWRGQSRSPLTKKTESTPHFPRAEEEQCFAAYQVIRKRQDAECAAAGRTRREKKVATKKSGLTGVAWDKAKGKWQGLASKPRGGQKHVGYFVDKHEAKRVVDAERAKLVEAYDAEMGKLAAVDPLTAGLPRAPADAKDAEKNKGYWHVSGKTTPPHTPYRVVRGGDQYEPACQKGECTSKAEAPGPGGARKFCVPCGGGCAHHREWQICRECNPNATKMMALCSSCAVRLGHKRQESKGGNGLCSTCEAHAKAEAAEAGTEPPTSCQKWEDVVLDRLTAMIVDTEGRVVSYEMRDCHSNMLGSLQAKAGVRSSKRKRDDQCDTTTKRRADVLYIVRDLDGRLVAAVNVEVDEHSHVTYSSQCEVGKVDDTFQALNDLAQKEGKSRHAATHIDGKMIYLYFLKFNPNACDAPGGTIRLETRIQALANKVNAFLRTPLDEFARRAAAGDNNVPHVEALYYHSKEGGAHLAHFDANCQTAWDWRGNSCPRTCFGTLVTKRSMRVCPPTALVTSF